MINIPQLTVDVQHCSACGEDHPQMAFTKLSQPKLIGELYFTHAGICPRTDKDVYLYASALPGLEVPY